jgi:ABC-type glycerol-3-phosphate transport system substrate-binding protein
MDKLNLDQLERLIREGRLSRRQVISYTFAAGGLAALSGPTTALLAACGQESKPSGGAGGKVPEGFPAINTSITGNKVTLKILLAADYADEAPFKDLYTSFQKTYPNITLNVDKAVWEDIPTKVKTAGLGGTPYDVAHQHAFDFGHVGLADNVDDLWSKWGKVGDFLPNSLDDVNWAGKKFGMPLDINCLFIVFNKDLFQQVGATPPTSNTTYTQLGQELAKFAGKPVKGVGLSNSNWTNYGLIRANGGDLLDQSEKKATINDPKNIAVISATTQLGYKLQVGTDPAPTKRQDQPTALFLAKQVAMIFTGPWDLPDVKKSGINVGAVELPKGFSGTTNGSVQGGGSLFIGKGSKNREAAFEFMKWATAKPHQMRMVKEMGRWPVIKAAYTDPAIGSDDPLLQPFVNQLKTAKPFRLEAYPEADKAWSDALAAAYNGTDAAQALNDAQKKAQSAIK